MGRKPMLLLHSYLLKINEDDRKKLSYLKKHGLKISKELREFINKKYQEISDDKKSL